MIRYPESDSGLEARPRSGEATDEAGFRRAVEIVNERGLHARASAKFVKTAAAFDARVTVARDGQEVDAQSIMGLMMLAAGPGAVIEIAAEGRQAEAVLDALCALVCRRFEEER